MVESVDDGDISPVDIRRQKSTSQDSQVSHGSPSHRQLRSFGTAAPPSAAARADPLPRSRRRGRLKRAP